LWLTTGSLKKETEAFLMAALRNNADKVKIDKQDGDKTCTMCKTKQETM